MAQSVTVKRFYVALAVIAVVGVGAIMVVGRSGSGGPVTLDPVPVGSAEAFSGYSLGSDSAPVEIIEYGDFQCGACARFAILNEPDVKRQLIETGRARFVFRDFPLPIHPNAPAAHHAAACAGEQGQFWPMHDNLFLNQGRWANERRPEQLFERLAEAVGLDMRQYDDCMDSGRYQQRIAATRQRGIELGVGSTPTFIIGNQMIPGIPPDVVATFEELVSRMEASAGR